MVTTPLQWKSAFTVAESSGTENENQGDIVQLSNGNILVTYKSSDDSGVGSPNGFDVLAKIYSPLGDLVSGPIRLNTSRSADDEQMPSVVALPGGGFVVTYVDLDITTAGFPPLPQFDFDLVGQVYDNSGTSLRSFVVADGPTSSAPVGPIEPQIAALSDTSAMIVWQDGVDVMARTLNPATGSRGATITVFSGATGSGEGLGGVEIAANAVSNEYALVYADHDPSGNNDEIMLEIFSSAGTRLHTVTVNSGFEDADDPSVAVLTSGRIVVSYTVDGSGGSDTGVRFNIYDSDGGLIRGATVPATTLPGNQLTTAVCALADGGFVVFWFDEDTKDVHGQRLNSAGNRVGSEFDVQNFGATDMTDIKATLLEDGRVAISFTAEFTSSSQDDVRMAIWDPRDVPNAPDSNGRIIGTTQSDSFTVATGAISVYGYDGSDRITVGSAEVDPAIRFDGGLGTDVLVIAAETGTHIWDFRGETVVGFEEIEFGSVTVSATDTATRTARFYASQLTGVTLFDFFDANFSTEHLEIYAGSVTTLDLSGVTVQDFGTSTGNVDTLSIFGDSSVETITGTAVADLISGAGGNDTIFGGNGADTIRGGTGADSMVGGSGLNTLSYEGSSGGVSVNLLAGTAFLADAEGDSFSGFTHLIGSSQGDVLTGSTAANRIEGGNGADQLRGDLGADTVEGGAGNDMLDVDNNDGTAGDVMDGGADYDIVRVIANAGSGTTIKDMRNVNFIGIEEVQFDNFFTDNTIYVSGSELGNGLASNLVLDGRDNAGVTDTFTVFVNGQTMIDLSGYTFQDWVSGGDQNDRIRVFGDALAQTIRGTSEIDQLYGNNGNDTLHGGAGGDTLDGGANTDMADYLDSGAGVNVSLLTGFASGGDATGDTLISIEGLSGSNHGDTLSGGNGAETLRGNDGDDILRGRAGADTMQGDGGIDTVSYSDSNAAVNVSLATGFASGGHATGDVFTSIENIEGSGHADILSGDAGANVLTGNGGDDLLRGRAGADTLDGGDGADWANYSDSNAAVNVSLLTGFTAGGHAAGDTYISIENFFGSAFDDTLNGDNGDNVLEGAAGADRLNGNGGLDMVSYAASGAAVNVSLLTGFTAGGDAAGDTYIGIEGFIGSAFDDTLNGDNGDNVLEGGAGADRLNGNGGVDLVSYASSAAGVNVSLATGFAAGGDAVGDTYIGMEGFIGSRQNDTLNGDNGDNVLDGGAGGADLLRGNGGADTFTFRNGFGTDTVADFQNGSDRFDFRANSQVTSFAQLIVTTVGADAVISDAFGNSITATGAAGQIDATDFLF